MDATSDVTPNTVTADTSKPTEDSVDAHTTDTVGGSSADTIPPHIGLCDCMIVYIIDDGSKECESWRERGGPSHEDEGGDHNEQS